MTPRGKYIYRPTRGSEFGKVRVVEIDGEPWLVGKDVAAVLGYSDTDKAIRTHVDNEDKLTRQFGGVGQNRCVTIINESGLYSLVLSSKLPGAKKFRRWVTAEVLPSIRKHGGYIAGQEQMFDDELSKQASCRQAGRYFFMFKSPSCNEKFDCCKEKLLVGCCKK